MNSSDNVTREQIEMHHVAICKSLVMDLYIYRLENPVMLKAVPFYFISRPSGRSRSYQRRFSCQNLRYDEV